MEKPTRSLALRLGTQRAAEGFARWLSDAPSADWKRCLQQADDILAEGLGFPKAANEPTDETLGRVRENLALATKVLWRRDRDVQ